MSYSTRYGGHIPESLNHSDPPQWDSKVVPLCEYDDSNYNCPHQRLREPINYMGIGTPLQTYEAIQTYHRNTGLMPGYGGHVPGAKITYGRTFGSSTVNAKKYLYN